MHAISGHCYWSHACGLRDARYVAAALALDLVFFYSKNAGFNSTAVARLLGLDINFVHAAAIKFLAARLRDVRSAIEA